MVWTEIGEKLDISFKVVPSQHASGPSISALYRAAGTKKVGYAGLSEVSGLGQS